MSAHQSYYCWIKLVSILAEDASATATNNNTSATNSAASSIDDPLGPRSNPNIRRPPGGTESAPLLPFNGHRPPPGTAGLAPWVGPLGNRPTDLKPPQGVTQVVFARWLLDYTFQGKAGSDLRVEYAAQQGSRDEAVDWIASDAGAAWRRNAQTYFLMNFELREPADLGAGGSALAVPVAAESAQAASLVTASDIPFPAEGWGPEYLEEIDQPTDYLPANWREPGVLSLKPPQHSQAQECAGVVEAMKAWDDPVIQAAIRYQALGGWQAIQPVIQATGVPDLEAAGCFRTLDLLGQAILDSLPPTYFLKRQFSRGRPESCCGLVPHLSTPKHPSYPSGHAAAAALTARLLSELVPQATAAIHSAAWQVGVNREIAGVHYRGDTEAGFELADQLFTLFNQNPDFRHLVDRARRDWA